MVHSRYPLIAKYQQTRRAVKAKNTTRTAVLGDETGNIYSDRRGYYFARRVLSADENGNALLGTTFYLRANPAAGILPNPGRKVLYKKDERGVYTIVGMDLDDLEQAGIDATALEPNDTARGFISLWQIVNLASYSISSDLLVNVYPWQYQTADNVVHFFEGTNAATQVDLTVSAPTDMDTHRYSLLVFNVTKHLAAANPLELYDGTAISLFTALTINGDLQTCYDLLPTDEIVIPIKAYYLAYGQTEIAGISKDIDVRQFVNIPTIQGSFAPADATYILKTANADLPNAQVMGALGTGLVKNTTATGVQSIAVANIEYLPPTSPVMTDATINGSITGTAIDTDITLGANSDTLLASQKAIKSYVDAVASGLSVKYSVLAATTATLPANTYSNGTAGVGATITASATGALTIDGQAVALNDRVLIKDESSASHNGVYLCTTAGSGGAAFVLTRATDMNQAAEIPGAFTFVENGTVNDGAGFVVASEGPFVIGTTAINWTQFSGAGQIDAGDGLDKTGNRLDVDSTVLRTTGTQSRGTGLTIDTPTIANFTNANHDHLDADDGGTLTPAVFGVQAANTALYGPTTGSDATPTFRIMVLADIPNLLITAAKIANATITLAKLAAGTLGKIIGFDSSGAAAEIDRAVDDIAATWGETVTIRQSVYKKASDDKWYKADRDAAGPLMSDTRGLVVDIGVSGGVVNTVGFVRRMGPVDGLSGLTNGDPLYLDTTAGGLTQTLPTPSLDGAMVMVSPYGYATSTTTAFIDTLKATIYRQFVTAAASAIVSLTHHPDINTARTVQVRAAIYTDAISDTYASSNQDVNISLRGPAGSTVTIDSSLTTTTFVGNNGGIIRRLAQSFSVTTAQRLTTFTPNFAGSTGIGITINWSLETDNSDKPSGTVIVSGTRNISVGPPLAITIPGAPLLAASTKYWMVFQYVPSPGSGNYHNIYFNNSGGYASGSMKAEAEVGGVFPGTWGVFGGTNDMSCTFTTSTGDGLAQSFTAASTASLTRIRLWLKKTGSPTGALTCALYSDSAGAPGSVITNGTAATVLASTLSTSYGWIEFAYSVPPPALTASTVYHIVLTTADAASSTNYVEWGADSSSPSVTGAMEVETGGSTWNTITPSTDACFEVYKRDATFIRVMPPGDFDTGTSGYGWTLGNSTPANEDTITRVKNLGVPRELYIDVSLP